MRKRVEIGLRIIYIIYPYANFKVDRLTRDVKKIMQGFSQGVDAAKKFLYRRDS